LRQKNEEEEEEEKKKKKKKKRRRGKKKKISGKVAVLWDVTWCSLVERGPGRGACCLNILPLWK